METLLELNFAEIISYIANIVFITWGIVSMFKERERKKEQANLFNAAYDMSERLANSLKDAHVKLQAEDVSSFLRAATRNLMNRKYDGVGGESYSIWSRILDRWFKDK